MYYVWAVVIAVFLAFLLAFSIGTLQASIDLIEAQNWMVAGKEGVQFTMDSNATYYVDTDEQQVSFTAVLVDAPIQITITNPDSEEAESIFFGQRADIEIELAPGGWRVAGVDSLEVTLSADHNIIITKSLDDDVFRVLLWQVFFSVIWIFVVTFIVVALVAVYLW